MPLQPIAGRPTFGGLWNFNRNLAECLQQLTHPEHITYGWAGYIMKEQAYALLSTLPWTDPKDVGKFFAVPTDAITDTDQKSREREWTYEKEMRDTLLNIETCLRTLFERCFDKAYHSGTSGGLGHRGFGNANPRDILTRLMVLYGKPTDQEMEKAFTRLLEPMDRNAPIEVMLRDIEDVQMFLLAHPEGEKEMSETQLIDYAMIKLSKTGGMYAKGMARWRKRDTTEKKKWMDYVKFMVAEYERLQHEMGGTTLGQEGYRGAYMETEEQDDDGSSLAASVVEYAEKASRTDTRVSDLEARLAAFEMSTHGQQQPPPMYGPMPPQSMYYTPEVNYMAPQQPMGGPPGAINFNGAGFGKKQKRSHDGGQGGNYVPQQQTMAANPPQQGNTQFPQQQGGWNNTGRPQGRGGGRGGGTAGRNAYSNTTKRFLNLWYCFSCGCDVDHDGFNCPAKKPNHIDNVRRDDAHKVMGACMKAAHKTMPDGTGAQPGWILAKQLSKPLWFIQQQEQYKSQQNQQGQQQRQQQYPQQQQWGQGQQQQQWRQPQQQQWGQNKQQNWNQGSNWQNQWRK